MGEPYSLNVCNEKIPGRKTSPGLWGKKDEEMGEKSLISSWKRICLNHTQQSLPNRHLCAFSAMWVMASRADGDRQEGWHLPSHHHHCLHLSGHTDLPRDTAQQVRMWHCLTAPGWGRTLENHPLFSALWEGFPSQGKLLRRGEALGNHPALGDTPKSHLEETRDQTAQGGNTEHP